MLSAKLMIGWRRVWVILVAAWMVVIPVSAQDAGDDAAMFEAVDAALTRLIEREDFSGAVLIARGDDIVFKEAYGYAVIEWEVPNTTDTVFRIGSITKQFTGMAILKLQAAGLLEIDDPICDYLERCSEAWSGITIYHLLTHTSGIPSYTDDGEVLDELMLSDVLPDGVVDTFIDLPLQFEPGSEWAYNNSGYHLLGDIVANVSGQIYGRYLQETFFKPLGMTNTSLESNTRVIPQMAEGYISEVQRAEYLNMNVPYSAGALISTVDDLFIWTRALHTGQIVPQETLDAMWERAFAVDDGFSYGYGLFHETLMGQELIWHAGGINGFASQASYLPEHDVTFITLTNRQNGAVGTALTRVLEIMFPT